MQIKHHTVKQVCACLVILEIYLIEVNEIKLTCAAWPLASPLVLETNEVLSLNTDFKFPFSCLVVNELIHLQA